MAQQAVSFDDIIQEGRRKKAAEKLAQEIFGKKGRSSAPPSGPKAPGLGGSLASRVGVTKRNSPSPRSTAPRQQLHTRPSRDDNYRPRPSRVHSVQEVVDLRDDDIVEDRPREERPRGRRNGYEREDLTNGSAELNIKGAASGPYLVVAQNFAPGTTAADIESVMLSVGGEMHSCKLITATPTVIAEMNFVEKAGAEKVIETFNGKKADGRPLYVYWQKDGGAKSKASTDQASRRQQSFNNAPQSSDEVEEVAMEVDENAESREAQNRLREERRGRDDRAPRDPFPTGPRRYQSDIDDYMDRRPRRPEPDYRGGRYGYGGGGYRGGPRGGYGMRDDRRYGGQSWRP